MTDPFTVERYVERPRYSPSNWVVVMTVPKPSIRNARSWLKAQGYQWTTSSRWRIVDREGSIVREFLPRGY